jgi:prophage regulatory protein
MTNTHRSKDDALGLNARDSFCFFTSEKRKNKAMHHPQSKTSDRIMRLKQIIRITGLSRSTIYHYMGLGMFPQSIKLGLRSVGWLESDIRQWMESKKAYEQIALI